MTRVGTARLARLLGHDAARTRSSRCTRRPRWPWPHSRRAGRAAAPAHPPPRSPDFVAHSQWMPSPVDRYLRGGGGGAERVPWARGLPPRARDRHRRAGAPMEFSRARWTRTRARRALGLFRPAWPTIVAMGGDAGLRLGRLPRRLPPRALLNDGSGRCRRWSGGRPGTRRLRASLARLAGTEPGGGWSAFVEGRAPRSLDRGGPCSSPRAGGDDARGGDRPPRFPAAALTGSLPGQERGKQRRFALRVRAIALVAAALTRGLCAGLLGPGR